MIHESFEHLSGRLREFVQHLTHNRQQLAGVRELIAPLIHEIVGNISHFESEIPRVEGKAQEIQDEHAAKESSYGSY